MHVRHPAQPGTPPAAAPRLWLIAGTGEGRTLALTLLARGWRLRVSVVTASAARAYPSHPALEVAVGALGPSDGVSPTVAATLLLQRAREQGDPFHWVVDATHPFALQITAALAEACRNSDQPLLRLRRAGPPPGQARLLAAPADLADWVGPGEPLLLAIGARRLAEAIAACPAALHHARLLPYPEALQRALAAGLHPSRLACLRPGPASEAITAALCRQWRIRSVLCRQSGGEGEAAWHRLCEELGLRLLLLRRPPEPTDLEALEPEALLARLGWPARWDAPAAEPPHLWPLPP